MFTSRKATIDDIGTIRDIAQKTWFETYKEILSTEQADYMFEMMYSVESLNNQMTNKGHQFYLAFNQDKPVGYMSIVLEEDLLFHIQKIYVLPGIQKSGLGKYLLNKAFEHAGNISENKKYSVVLNVNRYNKAVTFYQKMGMYISQEGDFDIGNGYFMNDYIMRIDF